MSSLSRNRPPVAAGASAAGDPHEIPARQRAVSDPQLVHRVDAVEARLLALETSRLVTIETRLSALSLPDQLAVMGQVQSALEATLRESVMRLEFFSSMARQLREALTDATDDARGESDLAGLPTVQDLATAVAGAQSRAASPAPIVTPTGGSKADKVDVPPEVAAMFAKLFASS